MTDFRPGLETTQMHSCTRAPTFISHCHSHMHNLARFKIPTPTSLSRRSGLTVCTVPCMKRVGILKSPSTADPTSSSDNYWTLKQMWLRLKFFHSSFAETNEQQWILIICYLSPHISTLKAVAGRAAAGSMIVWSMKKRNLNSHNPNKDRVCPVTGGRMPLRYKLPKGHLAAKENGNKPWLPNAGKSSFFFLEHDVYFEESQSSSCDILLFLEFKCIKKEPAYIDVVNQYCWRGELMLWCQVFHSKLAH